MCDFGLVVPIAQPYSRRAGTYTYMAPEIHASEAGSVHYTTASDIWSLGIVLLDLHQRHDRQLTKPGKTQMLDLRAIEDPLLLDFLQSVSSILPYA